MDDELKWQIQLHQKGYSDEEISRMGEAIGLVGGFRLTLPEPEIPNEQDDEFLVLLW